MRRVRTLGRLGGAVVATVGLGAILSGCLVFDGAINAKQVGDQPKVAVKFNLCNSDDEAGSTCPALGNSGDNGASGSWANEQALLGFRVPKGTSLPRGIRARTPGVEGRFERNPAYRRELLSKAPLRPGFTWFGFSASPLGDDGGADPNRYDAARFRVVMRLPAGFDGRRFKVRPVVGYWAGPDSAGPELDCGPDPFVPVLDTNSDVQVICIDAPTRQRTRKSISAEID